MSVARSPLLAGVAAIAVLLVGCSTPAEPAPGPMPAAGGDELSLSAAANQVYECITDRGWEVKLLWDGGIEASSDTIPEAQVDLFNADSAECWAEVDNRIAAMSDDEVAAVYKLELTTRECLIAQGLEVGDAPSEQQYVDSFFGSRWSAYGDSDVVRLMSDDQAWRDINVACPQPAWSLGTR